MVKRRRLKYSNQMFVTSDKVTIFLTVSRQLRQSTVFQDHKSWVRIFFFFFGELKWGYFLFRDVKYYELIPRDRNVPNFPPVHGDRLYIFLPVSSIIQPVQFKFLLMAAKTQCLQH